MHFCLVTMPYARIELSSVALGLLQATLTRAGFTAKSVYGNILFADRIGSVAYTRIAIFRPRLALADWTFAHLAFPDFAPDHNEYFNLVMTMNEVYAPLDRSELEDLFWTVRAAAAVFIHELAENIIHNNPRIVGCSSTFSQHVPSLALLREIRRLAPEVVTVMGGANCETIMGKSTHVLFPWVDYVVSGEADDLIVSLTQKILDHGKDVSVEELPVGVFAPGHRHIGYPGAASPPYHDLPRATSMSLENYPVPDYDDFVATIKAAKQVGDLIVPGLTVESSRGCWWGQRKACVFCGFNGKGMQFRAKSPEQFVNELAILYERYQIDGIEAVDNILDMSYLKTALPMLKAAGSPYRLYYEIKSNLLRHHVKILREAGVIWVQTGIESLNSHILQLMNKGCKAWQNIQLLKWLREFGIRVHWNMLYDFPEDQDDWYLEMAAILPLLSHLQPPIKMVPLEFCRFSVYHDHQSRYGLKLQASSPFKYVYPFKEEELNDLVYFFEDEERLRSERNPIVAFLTERQAFKILRRRVNGWRQVFWYERPVLSMRIIDDEVIINDTRPVAVNSSYRLVGLQKDLYLAADGAPTLATLINEFSTAVISREEIAAICQEFVTTKIAMEIDGHLLALAVREPIPDVPSVMQYPGGVVLPAPPVPQDDTKVPETKRG